MTAAHYHANPEGSNPYAVLGLPLFSGEQHIREAYKQHVKAYHPDVHTEAATKAEAECYFKAINEAYQRLSNKEKRMHEDIVLRQMLKNVAKRVRHGSTHAQSQHVANGLEEQAKQAERNEAPPVAPTKPDTPPPEMPPPPAAQAPPPAVEPAADTPPAPSLNVVCKAETGWFAGFGKTKHPLPLCKEGGQWQGCFYYPREATLQAGTYWLLLQFQGVAHLPESLVRLELPALEANCVGAKVAITLEGLESPICLQLQPQVEALTVPPADAPVFVDEDGQCVLKYYIPLSSAILGGEIKLPTPRGPAILLQVPAGTQSGQGFRLKNQGRNEGEDLKVILHVRIPSGQDARGMPVFNALQGLGY